ncbi:MAG: DUF1080 domain-containing protein [Draconibacterium sp.]|nr:DUF1080 domain-containing protein [Draconibacterium sp.]
MKRNYFLAAIFLIIVFGVQAQQNTDWIPLFTDDLSNADYRAGVWSIEDGVITATEDQCIWTQKEYENFILELEFKTAEGTNSGVIVYCTDTANWIQIRWKFKLPMILPNSGPRPIKPGNVLLFLAILAAKESRYEKPGEWNKMIVACKDKIIHVVLNGSTVTEMNMSLWTSGTKNPDGSDIPSWLSTPFAKLATKGKIGFQGKHAGAPIWFRNIKIQELQLLLFHQKLLK